MNVILTRTDDYFEKDLILEGKNPKVVAEIINRTDSDPKQTYTQVLLGVNWLIDPETLVPEEPDDPEDDREDDLEDGEFSEYGPNLHLFIHDLALAMGSKSSSYVKYCTSEKGLFTSNDDAHAKTIIQASVRNTRALYIVDNAEYDLMDQYMRAGHNLRKLYEEYPIYEKIIQVKDGKNQLVSLLDLIFDLDESERNDFILAISYAGGYIQTLKSIAERVLSLAKPEQGLSLMTQEQQVEGFIQFSKLVANDTTELVTDETLNAMRESDVYRRVTADLTKNGFGLSETQQFNALQSAAYLGANKRGQNVLYNLSDMGAGKTLMTVESLFIMDLKTVYDYYKNNGVGEFNESVKGLYLPNKNLIAPKLSVKSSWVSTFELFYNVEQVSDSEYTLSFEYEGAQIISTLNVASFTVKSSALHIDAALPEPTAKKEHLIIDEVHQLVERRVTRTRFFAKGIIPANRYISHVLSGTLSNLTTGEWLNYITFMGLPFKNKTLDGSTPNMLGDHTVEERGSLINTIKESVANIDINQHRTFDDDIFNKPQMTFSADKRMTNKNELFHLMYSSKVLPIHGIEEEGVTLYDRLSEGMFGVDFDFSISDAPNFELFYNLVGSSAVTAQSTQVAEELFGEQKQQHNADVINVQSPLDKNDIHLLRVLHQITRDHQVYKSPTIATAINNAILNLNDGLSKKNIYDLLAKYARSNTRFLAYLATLELNILEKLQESNLIKQPALKDTEKFRITQDILARESEETHLIVVNDGESMKALAEALGVSYFTKKQLNDPLNYQEMLDEMFEKQSVVIVPQMMIKSSLDLVQANRLIQYQLNAEISDIIQTQNRINRIGQTRETKAYYIATDVLQKNIIDLFLETYKNIRVAHKGIVELFVDMSSQVNVINDYISKAMSQIDESAIDDVVDEVDVAGEVDVIDEVDVVDEVEVANEVDVVDEVEVIDEVDVVDEVDVANEVEVVDEVEAAEDVVTEIFFNEDGIGRLFSDELPALETPEDEPSENETVWMSFGDRDKAQRSVFSPADKAFMHQMIPACSLQAG